MRCALPSSRVRSAHRLQPFSSDPRRTCVQVPASAEGEAAEAEGVLGAAGAASAAPEHAPVESSSLGAQLMMSLPWTAG